MIYVDEKEPVGGEAFANDNLLVADNGHYILSLVIFLIELVFSIVVSWLRLSQ